MNRKETIAAFYSLIQAGLWEKECRLEEFEVVDFNEIYKLAQEQSVVGLVTAGLEHVIDVCLPKDVVLQFIGETMQLEQRNIAMDKFIGVITKKMREAGIYTILVKGQGIAKCYNKPLWRSCGDVDLLLSLENYKKAKDFLSPLATSIDVEEEGPLHQAMMIDQWEVELHGTLHSGLYPKVDKTLDKIQKQVFEEGHIRSWSNGDVVVFLPRVDEDAVFIFAHILQHFFKGGIGLRQICDWSRLLWTYHDIIDKDLLKKRLISMGIMSEWNTFASLAVDTLGMPEESMPFYSPATTWKRKADRVLDYIIETGNFGHNWKSRACLTPEGKAMLTPENFFILTPLKS